MIELKPVTSFSYSDHDGRMNVKVEKVTYENGIEVSRGRPHRGVVDVGDDTSMWSQSVQNAAKALHTPEMIQVRQEREAKNKKREDELEKERRGRRL